MVLFSLVLDVLWGMLAFVWGKVRGHAKDDAKRGRGVGRLLTFFTGLLVFVIIGGYVAYSGIGISSNGLVFLAYGVVPAGMRAVLMLAPVVVVLALLSVVSLVRSWHNASAFGKIYLACLMICAAGVSGLLYSLGVFSSILA